MDRGKFFPNARTAESLEQIYNFATECNARFRQLRSLVDGAGKLLGVSPASIEQHEQRFWAWATGLGVFAEPSLSLDTKLQKHEEVKELVMMLLQILNANLNQVIASQTIGCALTSRQSQVVTESPQPLTNLTPSSEKAAHSPGQTIHASKKNIIVMGDGLLGNRNREPVDVQDALYGIEGALKRLERLSVLIRKASKRSLAQKVQSFAHDHPDDDFQRTIGLVLHHLFPNLDESMTEQLRGSIVHRRYRLLYERKHKDNITNSHRLAQHPSGADNHQPETGVSEDAGTTVSQSATEPENRSNVDIRSSRSTLDTNFKVWNNLSSGLVSPPASEVSQETLSTTATGEVDYPAPPKATPGELFVRCPICYGALDATKTTIRTQWRRHVDDDLEPWVCPSEECAHPLVFFSKYRLWKKHMQDFHTDNWPQLLHNKLTWTCSIDHEDPLQVTFDSANALGKHILQNHKTVASRGTDEVRNFAERSHIRKPGQHGVCPICGISVGDIGNNNSSDTDMASFTGPSTCTIPSIAQKRLSKHVSQHLKMLSFRSLDGLLANDDEDEVNEKDSCKARILENGPDGSWNADEGDDFGSDRMSLPYSDDIVLDDRIFPDVDFKSYSVKQKEDDNTAYRESCLSNEPQVREAPEWSFVTLLSMAFPDPLLEDFSRQQARSPYENKPSERQGLCILSFDGGGVRGITTLLILKHIMDRVNYTRNIDLGLPSVKPCDIFELIGGSGSGGIIAMMLGCLEMDVDQCIDEFKAFIKTTLEPDSKLMRRILSSSTPQSTSTRAEKAFRRTIDRSGRSEEAPLNDGFDHKCKTIIFSFSTELQKTIGLRSYSTPTKPKQDVTLWQAACTTWNAPVPIISYDDRLGATNTTKELELEASRIWCQDSGKLDAQLRCFLSVGSGIQKNSSSSFGHLTLSKQPKRARSQSHLVDSSPDDDSGRTYVAQWSTSSPYFRFDVIDGIQDVSLDTYNKSEILNTSIESCLSTPDSKALIEECVQALKHREILNKKHKPFWTVPYERNPHFTGHQAEIAKLHHMLVRGDKPIKITITGVAAIGKTQLVLELLWRVRELNEDYSVFWLPCGTSEQLLHAYRNMAQKLTIAQHPSSDTRRAVHQYLSTDEAGKWILVFDEVDHLNILSPEPGSKQVPDELLIDFLPQSKQGCIIFTTRNQNVASQLAQGPDYVLQLHPMDKRTAKMLFEKYLMPNKSTQRDAQKEAETNDLLRLLSYQPLAIAIVASQIKITNREIGEVLRDIRSHERHASPTFSQNRKKETEKKKIQNKNAQRTQNVPQITITGISGSSRSTTGLSIRTKSTSTEAQRGNQTYEETLKSCFNVSLHQIQQENSLAADYLSFIACVYPDVIPLSLLPSGPTSFDQLSAVAMLKEYSLVAVHPTDSTLSIHRLVQKEIQSLLEEKKELDRWREIVITRLVKVLSSDDLENRGRYIEHAMFIFNNNTGAKLHDGNTAKLALILGNYLFDQGRFEDAERILEPMVNNISGGVDLSLIRNISTLASIKMSIGKLAEAESLQQQAFKFSKSALGPEHPDTLRSMVQLAIVCLETSKVKEALELMGIALKIYKRIFGPEHPETLRAAENLGSILFRKGDLEKTEELTVDVLEVRKRILGEEHPEVCRGRINLAVIWKTQGKIEKALGAMEECVDQMVHIYGSAHPETVSAKQHLGAWQEEYLAKGKNKANELLGL